MKANKKLLIVLFCILITGTQCLYAQDEFFRDFISTPLKTPKKLLDYQTERNSAPALLVKGIDFLKPESRSLFLTRDLLSAWMDYYKELNFYDKEAVAARQDEMDSIAKSDKLYFSIELKLDTAKMAYKNIDVGDFYVFLLNDQGKIVDAKEIIKSDDYTLPNNGIHKFVAGFPIKIPGTKEYIKTKDTQNLKLYVNIQDTLYMFKYNMK